MALDRKKLHLLLLSVTLAGSIVASCGRAEVPNLNGVLVHVVKPLNGEKILPTTSPMPGRRGNTLNVVAAKGEFEAAGFVLKATDNSVNNLVLSPTDLIGPNGNISASNVDIKVVKVWYQAFYAWNSLGRGSISIDKQTLVPELLLNNDDLIRVDYDEQKNYLFLAKQQGEKKYVWINIQKLFDGPTDSLRAALNFQGYPIADAVRLAPTNLEKEKNKQFWVTVHVPQNALPGKYLGNITLKTGAVNLGQINIELTVLPFELRESKLTYGIYYRGKLYPNSVSLSSEYKNLEQFKAELTDILNHGVSNPIIYQDPTNESLFKQVLGLRQELGMGSMPLYLYGIRTDLFGRTLDSLFGLKQAVLKVIKIAHSFGIGEVYIYGRDEPKGKELISERAAWESVHKAGGKVFVAGYKGTFEAAGDLLDLFIYSAKPLPNEAKKFHSVGHKIFSYNNPQTGPENPLLFRRNYGVVLWGSGFDGAMPYAYQDCSGSCWNDLDDPQYRDQMFSYPTMNGVIDTIAWEGFREGIDDVRYITTLEYYIQIALNSDDLKRQALAKKANIFLEALRQTVTHDSGIEYTENLDLDLDLIRSQIIKYILELK